MIGESIEAYHPVKGQNKMFFVTHFDIFRAAIQNLSNSWFPKFDV